MPIKLDGRLAAAAALARLDRRICDVGTDHALLPCFLYEQGARGIIACDINDGPLAAAREAVLRHGFGDGIQVIKSDGLRDIPPCDDVIIAGMGGELIARIVTECRFVGSDTRFILQPMTKAELLRRELYLHGFEIISETCAQSGKKVYCVMLVRFSGKKAEIGERFAFYGKCDDPRYIEAVSRHLEKLAKGDPRYRELIFTHEREV